jgi:hypothetical protein
MKEVEIWRRFSRAGSRRWPLDERGNLMKTNYLVAIATFVACSESAIAFFPAQALTLVKGILGVVDWKCGVCLGMWRILASASLLLGTRMGDNKIVLFVLTHAAGYLVKFLLLLLGSVV